MTSLFMHYSQIEHILVSDDDITMDVIIYDSTLHGRPSQISGIFEGGKSVFFKQWWQNVLSSIMEGLPRCFSLTFGLNTTTFCDWHVVITAISDVYCLLSNWCNSTVLWHLHTDMIKIRTIMATTTTVMMISQKLLSSWSTNKNGLLIKTQNIIFFSFQ